MLTLRRGTLRRVLIHHAKNRQNSCGQANNFRLAPNTSFTKNMTQKQKLSTKIKRVSDETLTMVCMIFAVLSTILSRCQPTRPPHTHTALSQNSSPAENQPPAPYHLHRISDSKLLETCTNYPRPPPKPLSIEIFCSKIVLSKLYLQKASK